MYFSEMDEQITINVVMPKERCLTLVLKSNSTVKDLKNILMSDYGESTHGSFILGTKTLSLDQTELRDEGVMEDSWLIFEQSFAAHEVDNFAFNESTQYTTKEVDLTEQSIENVEVGGFMEMLPFNSLNQPYNKTFSKTAPKWRQLGYGLNLQGKCNNEKCEANGKLGWSHKGYGKFFLNKEVASTKCKICNQILQQINNMGLSMAECEVNGMMNGENQEKKMNFIQDKKGQFLTFQDKDVTRVTWKYLEMEVKQLKNN